MQTRGAQAVLRRRSGALIVIAVLIVGVLVSAMAAGQARRSEQRYLSQVMDGHANQISTVISERFTRYGETLSDLADAVGAQSDLQKADFDQIANGLSTGRLPGAGGVAFVVPAPAGQYSQLEARWRGQGDPELRFAPFGTSEHYFVIFEKSFDGASTKGLDLARSPEVGTALRTARNSDSLTISAPYQLLRDSQLPESQRQPSVVFATPVRQIGSTATSRFEGWLVMSVRGSDFMSQALRGDTAESVVLSLEDEKTSLSLVTSPAVATDLERSLYRERTLTIGQRLWRLGITPTEQLLSTNDRQTEAFTLGIGIVLTAMLTMMTAVLTGSRNRAFREVARATTALRDDISRREQVEIQLRKREEQLHHLAHHDPLTGIPNRAYFHESLERAIHAYEESGQILAVLFIDLDGFKSVNDQHGHRAGDIVLRETSIRITDSVRSGDTVARLGGDEFAVILEQLPTAADARATAARIGDATRVPIGIGDDTVAVTASIGVVVYNEHHNANSVLRDADIAMYAAKSGGKDRFVEAGPRREADTGT